jgi:predicted ATP-binding protein involved in virulence
MRIEELHLKNFRCFKELDIQFPESNLAVFIGLNGAGKSAILDALYSVLNDCITNEKTRYSPDDIFAGEKLVENKIIFKFDNKNLEWKVSNYNTSDTNDNKITEKLQNTENTFILVCYNVKKNFESFVKWFEQEENIESEEQRYKKDFGICSPKLEFVRRSILLFLSEMTKANFSDLRIIREKIMEDYFFDLYVDKNNISLKTTQLSDGERLLIYLVGDIACQISQKYKNFSKPIKQSDYYADFGKVFENTTGVVLIDEIELHLQPQWQREVLPALQKTFPNIQFIVTTHSPQVLSRVHKDDIFILKDNQLYQPSSNPIGRDSTDILDEVMDIKYKRPKEIQELSDKYFSLLNKNLFEEAQKIRNTLLDLVKNKKLDKDDPIFIRADGLIARKQLLRK